MMRLTILLSTCALLLASLPDTMRGQRPIVLSIAVADANSGAPIVDAEVVLVAQRRVARTNWLGEAFIDGVRAGRHRVRVRRLGYAPSDIHIDVRGDTAGAV